MIGSRLTEGKGRERERERGTHVEVLSNMYFFILFFSGNIRKRGGKGR